MGVVDSRNVEIMGYRSRPCSGQKIGGRFNVAGKSTYD